MASMAFNDVDDYLGKMIFISITFSGVSVIFALIIIFPEEAFILSTAGSNNLFNICNAKR